MSTLSMALGPNMASSSAPLDNSTSDDTITPSSPAIASPMPSAPRSVVDEMESPKITTFDVVSQKSIPPDSHESTSRWRLKAITKQDLVRGFHIIPPLAVVYIFGVVDRTCIEIVYELARETNLPFPIRRLDVLGTGYYLAVAAFAVPSCILCQIIGPRYWLPLLAVLGSVATLLVAFVHSYAGILLLRIFTGATFAGVLPSIAITLLPFFDDNGSVLPLALIVSGGPGLASMATPIADRIFSDVPAIGRANGWQAVVLVVGILTIAAGTVSLAIMPHFLFAGDIMKRHSVQPGARASYRATLSAICSRHCLIYGLILPGAIAVVSEQIAQVTPLKRTVSPEAGPTFSNIHLWDMLPDTLASLSTIVCGLVIYRKPLWADKVLLTLTSLSVLGSVIFLASSSAHNLGGEYTARILFTTATQCLIPLVYAALFGSPLRLTNKWQIAVVSAVTNVGFGLGGVIGIWQYQLPKIANAFIIFAGAVCILVLLVTHSIIERRNPKKATQHKEPA